MAAIPHHPSADLATIRHLSKLAPVKSLSAIGLEWIIIGCAVALPFLTGQPWLYIFSLIIIGTRMYALYSLLHDGIHYMLYPNKNANDVISRILLAWPLFISLQGMRANHFAHHKFLMTDKDPERNHLKYKEFTFPQSKSALVWVFLKDLSGINFLIYKSGVLVRFLRHLPHTIKSSGFNEKKSIWLFYLVLTGIMIYFNMAHYFILFWIVPYATIYQALNRWRLYTEHLNLPKGTAHQVRSLHLNPIQKFLFAPHNLGFHAEHHLYPSVPFYNLEQLHRQLSVRDDFTDYAVVETGYLSAMHQLTKP